MPELLGGRYRLGAMLGSGGMARVFTATDTLLDREVAVKVFSPEVSDPAHLERQRSEVRLLARLSHPNLVTVYDAELGGPPSYLVMELVPGPSLAQEIGPPMSTGQTARIGADVAAALAYIHGNGVTHRDVKPANILLTGAGEDAHAKLVDFGIAQLMDAPRLTQTGMAIGTAAYVSPEQVSGQPVGGASDVYSLGLVLIECLTGERCFDGVGIEVPLARLHKAPELPAGLPPNWVELLTSMTAFAADDRLSAAAVADRLVGLTRATEVLPSAPAATRLLVPPTRLIDVGTPPTENRRLRRAILVGAGVLLVAAVGTGLAISAGGGGKDHPVVAPASAVATPASTPSTSPSASPSPSTPPTSAAPALPAATAVLPAVSPDPAGPVAPAGPAGAGPLGQQGKDKAKGPGKHG